MQETPYVCQTRLTGVYLLFIVCISGIYAQYVTGGITRAEGEQGTCLQPFQARSGTPRRATRAQGTPARSDTEHERELELDIIISNASDKPIYDQIVSQMKALILTGELGEGQQLPSIRALAGDLRISVITTKRAYAELEAQGFIETVPGKGSFVAGGNLELLREERLRRIEELLAQAVDEAHGANVDVHDLHNMLDLIAESDD